MLNTKSKTRQCYAECQEKNSHLSTQIAAKQLFQWNKPSKPWESLSWSCLSFLNALNPPWYWNTRHAGTHLLTSKLLVKRLRVSVPPVSILRGFGTWSNWAFPQWFLWPSRNTLLEGKTSHGLGEKQTVIVVKQPNKPLWKKKDIIQGTAQKEGPPALPLCH